MQILVLFDEPELGTGTKLTVTVATEGLHGAAVTVYV